MEPKSAKVLDSRRYAVDFKRKRPHQVSIDRSGDSSFLLSIPETVLAKRRKLNMCGSTKHQQRPLGKSFVRYYMNFLKSGQPGRVLYYHGGDWTSFPLSHLDSVKEHFIKRNPIFEVELNGNVYLMDFVHMVMFDLKSGLQQSIAWIDEAGNCFFPEIVSDEADANLVVYEDESATNEINLQLEIDINVFDPSHFNECTGESDDIVAQDVVHKNPSKSLQKFDGFSDKSGVDVPSAIDKHVVFGSEHMDLDKVRNMFLSVMGSSDRIEIINVCRGSNPTLQVREELFFKQVEITAKHRGNANVRYAWLPCTKKASSSIMKYGIGSVALSTSVFGVGVHLSSADWANLSVNLSDVDENGVQYVVLCRVALGNMEVVNRGSDQFHPSNEDYDTAVDDLKSPKYHVIWNMDLNSRVYPQCLISFKATSNREGCNIQQENFCGTSEVQLESASNKMATKLLGVNNIAARTTPMARKPAWMPFPVLFAAISHRVSASAMNLIMTEYDQFKKEKKSRNEFVKKLRLIVGDQLLISTIKQFQCHQVSHPIEGLKPEGEPNLGC